MTHGTDQRDRIWAAWNAIDDDVSPVKRIARDLGLETSVVAAVVYPPVPFGEWDDSQEPDLDGDRRRHEGDG